MGWDEYLARAGHPVFMAGQEAAWAIFRFGTEHPGVHPGMRFQSAASPASCRSNPAHVRPPVAT